MRDTTEAPLARGGNVAFFSGNTSLWQVRLEGQDEQGRATQLVGWKGRFRHDPLYDTDRQAEVTTFWSDVILERPENHMTGVSFTRGGYHRIGKNVTNGAGGYTVHRSEEHTSELQSLMRISYAVFCLKKKNTIPTYNIYQYSTYLQY